MIEEPPVHPTDHTDAGAPKPAAEKTAGPGHERPGILPALVLLFAGSGCSALIYEIVWFQLLQLVIGSSAVSLGVLLGTFMGGMCLGSLLFPRLVSPRRNPLRVYAAIEGSIGAIGIFVLFAMPVADRVYAAHVGQGLAGIAMRGLLSAACLLPPALLMGATLPAVARRVESTPQGVAWLGFFYGGNLAGAVFGCLLAGFYLLRVHDMAFATYVAAAVNVTVAGVALLLGKYGSVGVWGYGGGGVAEWRSDEVAGQSAIPPEPAGKSAIRNPQSAIAAEPAEQSAICNLQSAIHTPTPPYFAIALSGMCALGAEVVWTRNLSLLLGGTVYTFSIILAVFLVGLGLGSSVGSLLGRQMRRPQAALGICQLLLMGAVAWGAQMIGRSLPYWPIDPSLSPGPWLMFQLDLVRCAWAVLPGALLWGASFPLALASAAAPGQDAGRLVGGIYAANTVGAIAGSLAFSLLLIPRFGTDGSQRVMVGLSGAAALLALFPLPEGRRVPVWLACTGISAAVLLPAALLIRGLPALPPEVIAFGRYLPRWDATTMVLYAGEGLSSSIAVTGDDTGMMKFHVSGKVEASSLPQDMRLQRMLGHLSALALPQPRSVLVVGCGAGVTAGCFVLHPSVSRIRLCEIEPLIPKTVAQYFSEENYNLMSDPRLQVTYDDARHCVLTTPEKFDVITSDPIHPWVKGSAALYTKEYFELCRRHLNPGGVVTQWVPLYESTPDAVRSELATFFAVFPDATVWSNDISGSGYDLVLLGRSEPAKIDAEALERRLARPDHKRVADSLKQVGLGDAVSLLSTYAGRGPDLAPWLKGAQINTDRNLRLQYLAGMGLNAFEGATIYDKIRSYRKYPEDLLVATPEQERMLRKALAAGK